MYFKYTMGLTGCPYDIPVLGAFRREGEGGGAELANRIHLASWTRFAEQLIKYGFSVDS